MPTSGRIHSEFLRLLYFLADRQASDYFTALGYEPHKEEYCHRRGVYFHQHRCTIVLATTRERRSRRPPPDGIGCLIKTRQTDRISEVRSHKTQPGLFT